LRARRRAPSGVLLLDSIAAATPGNHAFAFACDPSRRDRPDRSAAHTAVFDAPASFLQEMLEAIRS